jgi:glycosyltransferase involved in cell wall biosynthesis
MKLLYFHQHFSTPKGSTGTRSYEMAIRSLKDGHDVVMVCGSYSGGNTGLTNPFKWGRRSGIVDGIKIIEFNLSYSNSDGFVKRALLFLMYAFRSIIIALTYSYDVVFATTTPLTAGIPGIFARWIRGKTFIFEVRDLWPELPKAMGVITNPLVLNLMALLEYVSYKSAHRLIGLSPGICEGIASKGISKQKIVQISNGCDLELFANESQVWRPKEIDESDLIFIYSGTHGIANGLDSVLNAVSVLNERGRSGYKIILIGSGREKQRLINKAKAESLDNHIVFMEPVSKEKLVGLLKASDVGLQILADVPAFYFGTSPNKFFDYLAIGLPVLTNYPGWVANLIEQNQCGVSCSPSDSLKFADKVEYLLDNKLLLKNMGRNARQLGEKEFDRGLLSNHWVNWVFHGSKINCNE